MKKAIIGSMLIVSTLLFSACSFGSNRPVKIVTDEFDFDESFENIEISITCEDIHIMESKDDECHIVFTHPNIPKATIEVTKDTLKINEKSSSNLFLLSTNMDDTKLEIYLPSDEYENIDIDIASGDITVDEGFKFEDININTASGDILLTGVIADNIVIDTASGDVTFENSDASTIDIDSASGDITGTLLSGKDFDIDTAAGDINVPHDSEGGRCKINTASGDVNLEIA